jgi:hypothetical protein
VSLKSDRRKTMNSVYRRSYELANEDFWNSPQRKAVIKRIEDRERQIPGNPPPGGWAPLK